MSAFEDFFDAIFCINRTARRDRWNSVLEQCERFGLERVQRFEAHEGVMIDGSPFNGNFGCTASHRGVLEVIAHEGYERALVLEDDFCIVEPGQFAQDPVKDRLPFHAAWAKIEPEIPRDFDLLYLGAHFAEDLRQRVSPHIVRTGRVLTTSSYAVTASFARRMAPHIYGAAPVDNLFWHWNLTGNSYCVMPRLIVQAAGASDLSGHAQDYIGAMLDGSHEARLDARKAT